MLLPLTGVRFAIVIYALFASNIINLMPADIANSGNKITAFTIFFGFLSGFSERFARGLLEATGDRFVASTADHKQ